MFLDSISIIQFKNLKSPELFFSTNLNCFVGNNGSGKTNVLDAVHYLSLCKSAFSLTDAQAVNHADDFFVLEGRFVSDNGKKETITCSYKRSATKMVKRNGKEYDKLSEHIGLLPVVLVSPSDTVLIHDAADERRRFMNVFLSQIDKQYLNALVRYNQVLSQRNKLLKDGFSGDAEEILEVLDIQLSELGTLIYRKRGELIAGMNPLAGEYYRILSDDGEPVELSYKSDLAKGDFFELLKGSREKDRLMGHTTAGVHRDDLNMRIAGYSIRKYGSQGQQKSFLIALKLAQFDLIQQSKGLKPILLLDDVFDKLDMQRVENLIRLVSDNRFGQIFITDSNKVRLEGILSGVTNDFSLFSVSGGEVIKQ